MMSTRSAVLVLATPPRPLEQTSMMESYVAQT